MNPESDSVCKATQAEGAHRLLWLGLQRLGWRGGGWLQASVSLITS